MVGEEICDSVDEGKDQVSYILWDIEKRGWLQSSPWLPQIALNPESNDRDIVPGNCSLRQGGAFKEPPLPGRLR